MRRGKAARAGWERHQAAQQQQQVQVRRKVSRVESLKRILFNRSLVAMDDKKRRSKSAEAAAEAKRTVVDRGVGPDSGLSSEDDVMTPRASRLDLSSEIFDFDSVSQISVANSACLEAHDRLLHMRLVNWGSRKSVTWSRVHDYDTTVYIQYFVYYDVIMTNDVCVLKGE